MSDAISEFIVKGTLTLLVVASVVTWALVVAKALQGFRARRSDSRFLGVVEPLRALPAAEGLVQHRGPAARVASAAVAAWEHAKSEASDPFGFEVARDLLERGLRRQIQRERRASESGLAVLASIGSTAPFVGLFGTVWGIMHALRRISGAGSASLDVVAGPIGEALVATGVGIAVAVPAVLAYNYFVRRLKVHAAELEDFANSLVSTALRGLIGGAPASRDRAASAGISGIADGRGGASLREVRA
jgi:biopolymer transport protein ExbB